MSAVAPASVGPVPQSRLADATGVLYERHHRRIFGFCLSQLGSREDAEDAMQTTFINAQRGLSKGVVPQFELAWLFTIARNVCHNSRDSASRRGRIESVRDFEALQDTLTVPERGPGVSVAELTRALAAIPERQRRALLLREFEGLSYAEIAGELGVSLAAVETLIFRARRSVAEQLGQTEKVSRRGALAWILAGYKWLFQGSSAVPLKLAAVTATVATTATIAVVPGAREQTPPPVPVTPSVDVMRTNVVLPAVSRETASKPAPAPRPPRAAQRPEVNRPASVATAPGVAPKSEHVAATTALQSMPQALGKESKTAAPDTSGVTLPPVPEVPAQRLTDALPKVELSQVSLPQVSLPQVSLPPVTLPQVALPQMTVPPLP